MSHIDDLIRDLCPDGVEFRTLEEIFETRNGYTPSKSDPEAWAGNDVPWFRMDDIRSRGRILRDSTQRISASAVKGNKTFPADSILVATSATIGEHALVQVPHLSNQRFTNLAIKDNFKNSFDIKFLFYYCFKLDEWCTKNTTTSSFASVDMKGFKKFKFPIPPLEVQQEVAKTLDQFTQLEAELEAELEARKLQFTYYRNTLILQNATHCTPAKLKDIGRIITGKTPPATAEDSWGEHTNFATPSDIRTDTTRLSTTRRQLSAAGAKRLRNSLVPSGSILVTCIGADMGKAVENIGDCIPNQQINAIINDGSFSSRYLVHALSNMRTTLQRKASQGGGTMPLINKSDFSLIELSLPPLKEQYRIADILDDFDTLVNDLSFGLPAEIEARRKQYEYYRDRLLTFPEKK